MTTYLFYRFAYIILSVPFTAVLGTSNVPSCHVRELAHGSNNLLEITLSLYVESKFEQMHFDTKVHALTLIHERQIMFKSLLQP